MDIKSDDESSTSNNDENDDDDEAEATDITDSIQEAWERMIDMEVAAAPREAFPSFSPYCRFTQTGSCLV